MAYSEDALFKALLKNKPAPQPLKPMAVQVKKELAMPVPPPVEARPEPVIERSIPPPKIDLGPVIDSIIRLNSTLNQIHGTIKTIIVPILALILVVAIGILIQSK
jgi:hypothetical protein